VTDIYFFADYYVNIINCISNNVIHCRVVPCGRQIALQRQSLCHYIFGQLVLIVLLLTFAIFFDVSPIIVTPLSHAAFGDDVTGAYKIGMIICLIFLYQVWSTRHFQSLPPE